MVKIDVTVKFDNGLHSRPACSLVDIVKKSNSQVNIVTKENNIINAKSLIRILTAQIKENEQISIEITGEDELEVSNKIKELFA